jgi:DNA polymerase I
MDPARMHAHRYNCVWAGNPTCLYRVERKTQRGMLMPMVRSRAAVHSAPPGGVVLFDTYSILFRAFHALPPMTTSTHEPTSALYGASALFIKLLREQRPEALSFAVDTPKRTFRHERYAEYKAQRERAPSELALQLQRLPMLLAAFGVPVWSLPGYEADDVLATLATRLTETRGCEILIVSGDRDLLQLIEPSVRVWFVGARGKPATLYDLSAVRERFGVEPRQLPAWTALVGDTSDNLVGAPGIGPRTASQLVAAHGNVEGILAQLPYMRPSKVRTSLSEHAERLLLNEELARLRRDVPLATHTPLATPLTSVAVQRLEELFKELEFRSLIPRLKRLSAKRSDDSTSRR